MKKQELYKKAIDLWGKEAQIRLALEEMSELSTEILRLWRERGVVSNVENEIADVEIMMEQLRLIFDAKAISRFKARKIKRLKERIEKDSP